MNNNSKLVFCGDTNISYLTDNNKKKQLGTLLPTHNLSSVVDFQTRSRNNSAAAVNNILIDLDIVGTDEV